ncbi:MAG: hypothetical protein M1840_003706 [Geoglossum simile]|nr:MAG: hypothetical protein M1840_003706 [Geoglossum simile]
MEARKKAAMGLKPCIAELVRTQYCPPSMVLVVQKIMEVPVHTPRGPKQAFRLMLTDGEKMIQATLVADMHWFVVTREIVVGAFVVLDEYRLAKAMRKNKNGSVGYLQISDLHAIGYVDGYDPSRPAQSSEHPQLYDDSIAESEHESIREDQPPPKKARPDVRPTSLPPNRESTVDLVGNITEERKAGFNSGFIESSNRIPGPVYSKRLTPKGKDRLDIAGNDVHAKVGPEKDTSTISERSSLPSPLGAIPRSVYRRKIVEHWDRCHSVPFPQLLSPYSNARTTHKITNERKSGPHPKGEITDEQVHTLFPQACMSLSQYAISTIEGGKFLKRINRPLDIVTLKGLAGLVQKQNRICGEQASTTPGQLRVPLTYQPSDILAIVESPPTPIIKRSHLPPKCDITLSDPSTLKRIALSVFVDASNFAPAVGTICLIRNVRNHRFNGQSLNAYPEDCEGWDWFIPNPDWAVPAEKIGWLRSWWAERLERRGRWGGCEVDESDSEFGYPAEKPPPRERVLGGSDDGEDDD